MNNHIVHGAGGVLLRNNEVLVITERDTALEYGKVAGMISIPLGRLDGQAADYAARREFLEETGVSVWIAQRLGIIYIPGAVAEIYLMDTDQDSIPSPNEETLNPHWISICDLLAMPNEHVRPPTKAAVHSALTWQSSFAPSAASKHSQGH